MGRLVTPHRLNVLAVVVLFAGVAYFAARSFSTAPDLDRRPEKENRVHHQAGFSVIRPRNTRAEAGTEVTPAGTQHAIRILTAGGQSESAPALTVRTLPQPPDPAQLQRDGFAAGQFQGREAWVLTGTSGRNDTWMAVFSRAGRWFEITLNLPGGEGREAMPPRKWRPYVESFRNYGDAQTYD